MDGHIDPTENGFVTNLLQSAKRTRYMNVTKKDVVSSDMLVECYVCAHCILLTGKLIRFRPSGTCIPC